MTANRAASYLRFSGSDTRNPHVADWTTDYRERDNLEFFADALAALERDQTCHNSLGLIALFGQRDLQGTVLRQSQAIVRWDLRPSFWSHVALIPTRLEATRAALEHAPLLEATLHDRTGSFPLPEHNGIGLGRFGLYADPDVDANVALFAVEMSESDAQAVVAQGSNPNLDRLRYDFWEQLGIWRSYLWNNGAIGTQDNPLAAGVPVPAAAYVQMAYEAIGVDLAPGAADRSLAPEHIWNAALWWHDHLVGQGRAVRGFYCIRDETASTLRPRQAGQLWRSLVALLQEDQAPPQERKRYRDTPRLAD